MKTAVPKKKKFSKNNIQNNSVRKVTVFFKKKKPFSKEQISEKILFLKKKEKNIGVVIGVLN